MKWTLTPFDKAILALVIPNLADLIEKLTGGLTAKQALINFAVSVLSGAGVWWKANA